MDAALSFEPGQLNNGYIYEDVIHESRLKPLKGLAATVLNYYASNYLHSSQQVWLSKILAGHIYIDGQQETNPERIVSVGMRLAYHRPPWAEPAVPLIPGGKIQVLYRDEHAAVVMKPRGWPCLPGGLFHERTLLSILKAQSSPADLNSITHRLGRGTTGALLLARTDLGRRKLTVEFQKRTMEKQYLAVMKGLVEKSEFTVNCGIGKVKYLHCKLTQFLWSACPDDPDAKPSVSHFKVLRRIPSKNVTVCSVDIETGRPHQIRIHSAYAGHPLNGDPLYKEGGVPYETASAADDDENFEPEEATEATDSNPKKRAALPGDCGYLLHSYKISFHDVNDPARLVTVLAPPPAEIQELLDIGE